MDRCAEQQARAEQLLADIAQLEQLLACLKAAVVRISGERRRSRPATSVPQGDALIRTDTAASLERNKESCAREIHIFHPHEFQRGLT